MDFVGDALEDMELAFGRGLHRFCDPTGKATRFKNADGEVFESTEDALKYCVSTAIDKCRDSLSAAAAAQGLNIEDYLNRYCIFQYRALPRFFTTEISMAASYLQPC